MKGVKTMNNLFITTSVVLLMFMFFCVYLMVRNEIVFRERNRIITIVHEAVMQRINDDVENYMKPWDRYNLMPSYEQMMWQLFKFKWQLPNEPIKPTP